MGQSKSIKLAKLCGFYSPCYSSIIEYSLLSGKKDDPARLTSMILKTGTIYAQKVSQRT
jgi:hypothetical protein